MRALLPFTARKTASTPPSFCANGVKSETPSLATSVTCAPRATRRSRRAETARCCVSSTRGHHQHPAGAEAQEVFGRGDAFVLRRQREAGVAVGRRCLATVERQHRHLQRHLGEQRIHLVATERADDEVVAFGGGAVVRGQRAAGRARGVVEAHIGATAGFAVVAGEEAVAHRRGGDGEVARHRQQYAQLDRRTVAVAVGRRAAGRVELPGAAVEGTRQRQAAAQQGVAEVVVERVAGGQRGGLPRQRGVVERAEQALDLAVVGAAGAAGEIDAVARELAGLGDRRIAAGLRGAGAGRTDRGATAEQEGAHRRGQHALHRNPLRSSTHRQASAATRRGLGTG